MALLKRFVPKSSTISRCLAGVYPEFGRARCSIAFIAPAQTGTREHRPFFRFEHVRTLHSEATHGTAVEVDFNRLGGEDTGRCSRAL